MPRVSRKNLETSYFHIIVQGINREYIFEREEEIEEYRKLLIKENKEKEFKILAYCIVNNHAHILIYSEDIRKMGQAMGKINTTYAVHYNRRRKRVGYVFRDRYYTQGIYEMEQLYKCIAYIHKNPVKASIVKNERDYKYSTYRQYEKESGIVDKSTLKLTFGANNKETFYAVHEEDLSGINDIDEKKTAKDYIGGECVENLSREEKCKIVKELRGKGCTIRDIGKTLKINIAIVHKLIK